MQAFNELNIKALRLFVAVLDHGSFSEVARKEGVAPSSISRQMQLMEQALNQQLLYRHTRAVTATESGRLLATYARRVLEQLEEAEQALQEKKLEPAGLVRINAPVVFGRLHIAPYIPELCQKYPKLCVELVQTDNFVDPMQDASDLLFRIGILSDSNLQGRVLAQQNYRIAASPEYLHRFGIPTTPEELAHHNCIVFKGFAGAQRWFFHMNNQWVPYSLQGSLTGNNADSLLDAAIQGLGIVVFPTWLLGDALQEGRLVSLMEKYPVSTRLEPQQLAALYPQSRRLPLKVRVVIDFFVQKFGTPAYWDNV